MNIPVKIQLGISGDEQDSGFLPIDEDTIGNSSSWAGSYHILSMGRHYDDYIYRPTPEMQKVLDFPKLGCFGRLTSKTKSQQVVGNIGECVAALLARDRLNADISDIALLTTTAKRMRPDYLMNLGGLEIRTLFSKVPLDTRQLNYLDRKRWWPVESKATKRNDSKDSRVKALKQLISFWLKEKDKLPAPAGYGLIVTFFYDDSDLEHHPEKILVSLILPSDPSGLLKQFENPNFRSKDKRIKENTYLATFMYFYDCSIS